MRKIFIGILFVFSISVFSQYNQTYVLPEYFQQEVNYTISVTLNDQAHTLHAYEEFEYINHSPDTLKYLYIHLWPNAYKNHSTAFAKQLLDLGEKKFYFSDPEERGYIDSLNFQVDGKPCQWRLLKDTIDVAVLYLPQPLVPHQSVKISTPFFVKIPSARFSRLGHLKNAYYITQWYPKPAVYDRYGWHPMPYLHYGEYYSDYGHFDVRITLPKNYVVAATGNRLPDTEEEAFMQQRIELTKQLIERKTDTVWSNRFPESSKDYKTVRFVESHVHDFAWFADKRFLILTDEIELFESKKKVQTWLYFTPNNFGLWKKALEYLNEACLFHSYYVGNYPYNHISIVDGSTAAGGGMEYPTIALVNQSSNKLQLEVVIVHEVAHNWFYGIIGTNERNFPAMDEGLVSFYEMRYFQKKYPDARLSEMVGFPSGKKFMGLEKIPYRKYYEWLYGLVATHNADMPLLNHSANYTQWNLDAIVYKKTAIVTDYLKNYFGEEVFDKAMPFYFQTFKYKHPYPQDLKILLDYFGGGNNLELIENLTTTTKKIDYTITRLKKNNNKGYELTIKNKGQMTAPVVIQAIKDNRVVAELWKNNIQKKETAAFPPVDADYFRIDYHEIMPEINRRNNTIRTSGIFKKTEPLQLNFGWKVDDFYKTQIHWMPIMGWNFNDGTMLGLAFYNYGLFPKKIEGFVAPLYAFKSNTLVGSGDVYVNFFPRRILKIFQLGIAGKSYTYWYSKNAFTDQKEFHQYLKLEPYIQTQFKQKNPLRHQHHYITARSVLLTDRTTETPLYPSSHPTINWINEYVYQYDNTQVLMPHTLSVKLQHNDKMAKTFFTFSGKILTAPSNYFKYRLFVGSFLMGQEKDKAPYAFRPAGYSHTQDYMMDHYYFGRNQGGVFYRQQFIEREGGLKTWTALGYSTHWMGAVNVYSPSFKRFRVFADLVFSNEKYLNVKQQKYTYALFDAGIEFSISDFVSVYFPVLMSDVLKDNLQLNGFDKWYQWIRYSINLHRINPRFEATKRIE